jgi:hypothetical protein
VTPAVSAKLAKLPDEVRDRVLERAAILITHAGMAPDDADERALLLEAGIATQRELGT